MITSTPLRRPASRYGAGLRAVLAVLIATATLALGCASASFGAARDNGPQRAGCDPETFADPSGNACFAGLILPDKVARFASIWGDSLEDVWVDSRGGEVRAAWQLGRLIHERSALLRVVGACHSACANYLVPAASPRLVVERGGSVVLHGTPAREFGAGFMRGYMRQSGLTPEEVMTPAGRARLGEAYSEYAQTFVVPEVEYFAAIRKNEAYATRYWEVWRNMNARMSATCQAERGLALAVGPSYLDAFGIAYEEFWWPEDRLELVQAIDWGANYAIVFDFDDYVGYKPESGLLSRTECFGVSARAVGP